MAAAMRPWNQSLSLPKARSLGENESLLYSLIHARFALKCDPIAIYSHGSMCICSFRRMGSKSGHFEAVSALLGLIRPSPRSSARQSISSAIFTKNWVTCHACQSKFGHEIQSMLTGFANHLPPPVSNQLKWPPMEVVHRTVYGFCLNSSNGMASLAAICVVQSENPWDCSYMSCTGATHWIVFCIDGK